MRTECVSAGSCENPTGSEQQTDEVLFFTSHRSQCRFQSVQNKNVRGKRPSSELGLGRFLPTPQPRSSAVYVQAGSRLTAAAFLVCWDSTQKSFSYIFIKSAFPRQVWSFQFKTCRIHDNTTLTQHQHNINTTLYRLNKQTPVNVHNEALLVNIVEFYEWFLQLKQIIFSVRC